MRYSSSLKRPVGTLPERKRMASVKSCCGQHSLICFYRQYLRILRDLSPKDSYWVTGHIPTAMPHNVQQEHSANVIHLHWKVDLLSSAWKLWTDMADGHSRVPSSLLQVSLDGMPRAGAAPWRCPKCLQGWCWSPTLRSYIRVITWKFDLFDGDGPYWKSLKRLYKWEENLLCAAWKEHLTVPPVTTLPLLWAPPRGRVCRMSVPVPCMWLALMLWNRMSKWWRITSQIMNCSFPYQGVGYSRSRFLWKQFVRNFGFWKGSWDVVYSRMFPLF